MNTFRRNAYRVLRIPAGASASEIQKAADRMRRAEPGLFRTAEVDIPELGAVSRGDADLCAAVDRLANPVHRLTDRLFWFCQLPTPAGAGRMSSAMDPAGHDAVLRDLMRSMQGGLDESGLAAWVETLRAWHAVTNDDDYWFLALVPEDQGSFESPATTEEVEAVRADAVRIAAEPLLIAAHAARAAGDEDTVGRVVTALSQLTDTGPWAVAAREEIDRRRLRSPVSS